MEDSFRCLTDFLPMTNQKKPMGPDNEFVELLWRNGNVTMHSQNHQRNHGNVSELKQTQKLDQVQTYEQSLGNSSNLIQESETESWFQYPLDDSFEEEFCSEFFPEIASTDKVVSDKISKNFNAEEDMRLKFDSTNGSNAFTAFASNQSLQENKMPPPRFHFMFSTQSSCSENCGVQNLLHLSKSKKADLGSLSCQLGHKGSASNSKADAQESSMMTVGSSICRSNQIQSQTNPDDPLSNDAADIIAGVKEDTGLRVPSEKRQSKAHDGTVTSSSGGSGCSYGRTGHQNASNQNHKRKERDIVDSRCQSEEAEYETIREKQSSQQPTSKCRSRAAEVHNLSERRRRDRINEKMKALQELIPHCNKTDKASMLDEAIEYMKSLQLQVQMMWMGTTTASSMMFPGVQQYMSGMGVGMSHASMPTIHSAVQFPRVPFVNQSVTSAYSANQTSTFPSPVINAVNFPNQMQNNHLPESYAGCLGFHIMQPHQAMDFCTFGYHKMQQNHSSVEPSSSLLCGTGEPTCVNIGHDKSD